MCVDVCPHSMYCALHNIVKRTHIQMGMCVAICLVADGIAVLAPLAHVYKRASAVICARTVFQPLYAKDAAIQSAPFKQTIISPSCTAASSWTCAHTPRLHHRPMAPFSRSLHDFQTGVAGLPRTTTPLGDWTSWSVDPPGVGRRHWALREQPRGCRHMLL